VLNIGGFWDFIFDLFELLKQLICIIQQLSEYVALSWLLLQLFCVTCEPGSHVRVFQSNIC
jgi:hypothetical protein